jgi:raffinose/stachyose/melibiose transport system substrate-binding protein
MSRRSLLGLAAGAAFAPFLGGCGSGGAGQSPDVTIWYSFSSTQEQEWLLKNVVGPFEKASGATVSFSNETYVQVLETALAAGKGPTIVYADPTYVTPYVHVGDFRQLDDYAAKYGWRQKFLPWAYNAASTSGNLYTLPERLETMVMFYRPDVLAKHGWTVPRTGTELEGLCAEAMKAGLVPLAGGSADWHPAIEWWMSMWWNHFSGPQTFYKALKGDVPWTDPAIVDGVALLKSYFDRGWIAGGAQKFFTDDSTNSEALVANGTALFGPIGTWALPSISGYFKSDSEWDWAPVPALAGGVPYPLYEVSIGAMVGLNARVSDREADAAAAFLDQFVANAQVCAQALAAVGKEMNCLTFPSSIFPSDTPPQMRRLYDDLQQASSSSKIGYTTWSFLPAATDTYLYQNLQAVMLGELSPQAFCQGLQGQFTQALDSGLVPSIPPTEA